MSGIRIVGPVLGKSRSIVVESQVFYSLLLAVSPIVASVALVGSDQKFRGKNIENGGWRNLDHFDALEIFGRNNEQVLSVAAVLGGNELESLGAGKIGVELDHFEKNGIFRVGYVEYGNRARSFHRNEGDGATIDGGYLDPFGFRTFVIRTSVRIRTDLESLAVKQISGIKNQSPLLVVDGEASSPEGETLVGSDGSIPVFVPGRYLQAVSSANGQIEILGTIFV